MELLLALIIAQLGLLLYLVWSLPSGLLADLSASQARGLQPFLEMQSGIDQAFLAELKQIKATMTPPAAEAGTVARPKQKLVKKLG